MHGDGRQSRDFTYVADAVAGQPARRRRAGRRSARAGRYNIAGGDTYDLLELLAILEEILGVECRPAHADPRAGDVRHTLADVSAAATTSATSRRSRSTTACADTVAWFSHRAIATEESVR